MSSPLELLRLAAELLFLILLFAGGYWLPVALAERRVLRSARLGESLPAAIRRAQRWRWVTAPLAVLLGLLFIGLSLQ